MQRPGRRRRSEKRQREVAAETSGWLWRPGRRDSQGTGGGCGGVVVWEGSSGVGGRRLPKWIGFSLGDTNLVLREFEKCGVVLRHVPGPRNANWMHILYQSRHDAHKALARHGQQLNSVLIIGVKPVDTWQLKYLNENTNENYQDSATVPFPSQPIAPSGFATRNALAPLPSNSIMNGSSNESGRGGSGAIASPSKSVLSKVMDLMFGL
nr:unnamed protein product [Digitaria exilis]